MLVALRNARPLHRPHRAFFHAAIAGHDDVTLRPVGTRYPFPSRPSAKRAILNRHKNRDLLCRRWALARRPSPCPQHTSARLARQAVVCWNPVEGTRMKAKNAGRDAGATNSKFQPNPKNSKLPVRSAPSAAASLAQSHVAEASLLSALPPATTPAAPHAQTRPSGVPSQSFFRACSE
jgi:hypothetical protein